MEVKMPAAEMVDMALLKPYKKNTKRHNQTQIDNVAESIRKFGFVQPFVIDKNNEVVIGHCRLLAAQKLGIKELPCVRVDYLTAAQVKALRILDNKLNESEWDLDFLNEELPEIDLTGFDVDFDFAVSANGFDEIVEDEPPAVDEQHEPLAKVGDVWQLGEHRLMCGDSTDVLNINILMQGKKADLVFTDPPYGMNAVSKSGVLSERYKTDIMNDDTNEVAIAAFHLCQKMFADAKQVWWGANYYTECLPSAECWIVWDKNNGESDQTDCELGWSNFRSVVRQFTLASEKTNRVHPTQKPIKLIQMILDKFDKDKSYNVILDLFGGSGSTLIACEQLNRTCYMMELDPKYCDVIIHRWENFTGQTAMRL